MFVPNKQKSVHVCVTWQNKVLLQGNSLWNLGYFTVPDTHRIPTQKWFAGYSALRKAQNTILFKQESETRMTTSVLKQDPNT